MSKVKRPSDGSGSSSDSKRVPIQVERLRRLYGTIKPSEQKGRAVRMAIRKVSMQDIANNIKVKLATAEVYVIDGLAHGAPLNEEFLKDELNLSKTSFSAVKRLVQRPEITLRAIKDNLKEEMDLELSYNQIRFAVACLIRGYDLSM